MAASFRDSELSLILDSFDRLLFECIANDLVYIYLNGAMTKSADYVDFIP